MNTYHTAFSSRETQSFIYRFLPLSHFRNAHFCRGTSESRASVAPLEEFRQKVETLSTRDYIQCTECWLRGYDYTARVRDALVRSRNGYIALFTCGFDVWVGYKWISLSIVVFSMLRLNTSAQHLNSSAGCAKTTKKPSSHNIRSLWFLSIFRFSRRRGVILREF